MSVAGTGVAEETAARHHHAVLAYPRVRQIAPPETYVDFLGTRTRHQFEAAMRGDEPPRTMRQTTPEYPGFNEEYFEWIDILEAVAEASGTFVMVELGAGYGRWLMRAASALRQKPGCRFQSVGIEPEPDHFRWLLQNYRDNGVDPAEHELTWAAIGAEPGFVPFWIGEADGWYGQAVAAAAADAVPDVKARRRLKARSVLGRPPAWKPEGKTVVWVPQVTLVDVLAPYPRIDLIDLDVQGAEVDVLQPAMGLLTARVRRVHIGTHAHALEARLRELFAQYGWEKINDYPCQSQSATAFGVVDFGDGVQTWLNPLLAPRQPAAVDVPPSPASLPTASETSPGLKQRLESAKEKNRLLKEESAALRARVRALEERLHAGSHAKWSFKRWLGRT